VGKGRTFSDRDFQGLLQGRTYILTETLKDANMNEQLDSLIERLSAEPTDRQLGSFESEVSRRIRLRRVQLQAAAALVPVRLASIGLALAVGVTTGGVVATRSFAAPRPRSPFAVADNLAPSTLLEDGR
jgi:hypothetical protein